MAEPHLKTKTGLTRDQFDQWLVDLRSGKFKQATGALHVCRASQYPISPMGFCCLGVLAQQVAKPINNKDIHREYEFKKSFWSKPEKHVSYVPRWMISVEADDQLVKMNDREKLPFTQIADWIETNLAPKSE